jgi:hypothetical protein
MTAEYWHNEARLPIEAHGKHKEKWLKYVTALGRCASAHVVGPANFPVERNKKRWDLAHKRRAEYEYFVDCTLNPKVKIQRVPAAVRLAELEQALFDMQEYYQNPENHKVLKSFGGYFDANALRAAIRRERDKVEAARKAQQYVTTGDVRFKCDDIRVWFEFRGKPSQDVIDELKRNGFKWTPSKDHWGRQLTANAMFAAKRVDKYLKEST